MTRPGGVFDGAGPQGPAPSWPQGGRQVIPRPADAYAGATAPWAATPPERRRHLTLGAVEGTLRRHWSSPAVGSTAGEPPDGFPDPGAPAAVLVALFEEAGETRVVLTRRAANLRAHRGEVSFPGGRIDAGEEPEDAARREAAEEIGLDPGSVAVIGRLSPLSTFASSSRITPVVGVLPTRPRLAPNPAEVEHGFDVALADLAAEGVFREERWVRPGRPAPPAHLDVDGSFPVWFFELPDDTVWGATARVLVELLGIVLDV